MDQQSTLAKMVMLSVRVTDANNHAVRDVNQEAFQVTEDGVAQKIVYFSNADVPLTYGLVIDNSGSLRSQLESVVRAGVRIVEKNKPDDDAFVIRFISSDKVSLVQDVTSNKDKLVEALENLYVEGGQTAVVDAVYVAAEKLAKLKADNSRRHALILITDGEDRRSFYKPKDLFSFLSSADVQIYVIGLPGEIREGSKARATELLTRLGTDTGGRVFLPRSPGELTNIADEIVNDVRTQYVIGYVPSGQNATNTFHKVQVTIADDPNREKRLAVTRVGYSLAQVK